MTNLTSNRNARKDILRAIRANLIASVSHDAVHTDIASHNLERHDDGSATIPVATVEPLDSPSLVELFRASLEAADGQCFIVSGEAEVAGALTRIIAGLQGTKLKARKLALSDSPVVGRLAALITVEVDEIAVAPDAEELFSFDIGITGAQAAIAETGTLVLDSERERHRLVSLLPPVHIAIIEASQIYLTLGETLALLQQGEEVSQTITFVTGPSRTADIELTLAIGVHGPQEFYVIVNEGPRLTTNSTGQLKQQCKS